MMRPHLRVRMAGRKAWVTRKQDFRLTSINSSQSRSVISSRGCWRAMPALFTRMSISPSDVCASAASRSTSRATETSA